MVNIFSFVLFGASDKYCKGLLKNIELIQNYFPTWECWIAIGNDVPNKILEELKQYSFVRLSFTGESGLVNKFYRFFPIDNKNVDICIVRDVDSRLYERDRACIHDFIQSDKKFHIIRDHPNHHHFILAGMFGMKQNFLPFSLYERFLEYRKNHEVTTFWNDQEFLRACFFPAVIPFSMIHDDLQQFEPDEYKSYFRVGPDEKGLHFVGQAYDFDSEGNEYPLYSDFLDGGVYGKSFWTEHRLKRISTRPS